MSSFDPKKANAAAKAAVKAKAAKAKTTDETKPEVSKHLQRRADMTQEKAQLDADKSIIVEEELKRYNFLRSKIDWDSLREFYKNPSDDHELYGNHLNMDRWLLFVELVLFLHDNIRTSQVKTVKSKTSDDDDVPISSKITLGAIRSTAPLIPYAPLKPFNFGENGNEKTSIQHLLNFMQQNKSLGRLFIEQKLGIEHNKSDDEDDEDDEDLFGDDSDEKKEKKRAREIAEKIDLNKKFDAFVADQDAIEYIGHIGHKERPVSKQAVSQQPIDEVETVEQDRFKELRKKWQNKTAPSDQHTQRDDRFDKLEKYSSRMGPIKQKASLTKYFPNDGEDISNELYDRIIAKNGSLNDYLLGIARIAVFVDDNYLRRVAKTFNQKLERQYYNLYSLLDVTVDEILQEIYQHPDNHDSIATIAEQVSVQLENYVTTIMKRITNQPYNDYAAEQTRKSLGKSFQVINESPSLNKNDCSNKDDVSSTEDLDIIYYTDTDDKKVYCFKLFDLYEQFEGKDFDNRKSGKRFNQTFIDNILSHHKKPKSPVKIKDRSSLDDVLHSDIDESSLLDFFKAIESGLDPELKAEYDKEFGGSLAKK
jgi:hypothetical protein